MILRCGVKSFPEGEHHTWTNEEIASFEKRWPIGTRERTAFALLLHTGERFGDVRKMSWRDIEGTSIHVTQGKTTAKLLIPLHPDLAAVLEQWPRAHIAMLTTNYGKPFTVKVSATGWRRPSAKPDYRIAVLPTASARRRRGCLAEAGCTAHEIMAITGHESLKEVERYTKAADQPRLAKAAIERTTNKPAQP